MALRAIAICFTAAIVLTLSPFEKLFGQRRDSISMKQLEKTDIVDFAGQLLTPKKPKRKYQPAPEGTVHFSVIPIAPSTSGKGAISVSAINASFYMDKHTNLSTIYFYPYTNFTTAYGIQLSPYIWFPKNEWNGTGDFRFVYNGLRDHGLGGTVPPHDNTVVEYTHIRTYFSANTRVLPNFYLGVGYNMDRFFGVIEKDPTPESPSDFTLYGIGTGPSTTSSGIAINILRDNRKNSVNPTNGYYTALTIGMSRKSMGSSYDWSSVFLDVRRYKSFSATRHKILAGRAFYWGTYGDVPYLNLPATLEDPSWRAGRGYITNRFRGASWLYAEGEYRFDISSKGFFGAVLFANVQSYTGINGRFDRALAAAGFGLRFKFNRHTDTNLTIDFAYGKEGLNWYINLGEYF